MALSKRLRYEILRRDNYTCRYCGASAPEVHLTVDHVVPVALGGQDAPENLVAACRDCNAGKTSVAPDSRLVADVKASAGVYLLALQDGFTRLRALYEDENRFESRFMNAWSEWRTRPNDDPVPLPNGWQQSIRRWHRIGIPADLLVDSVERAMTKKGLTPPDRFRYMAGIVWRTIDEIGSIETVTLETVKVFTQIEADNLELEAWREGWEAALERSAESRAETRANSASEANS